MSKKEVKRPPSEVKYRNGKTREEVDAQWEQWMEDAPSDATVNRSSKLKSYSSRVDVAHRRSQWLSQSRKNAEFNQSLSEALKLSCGTKEARAKNKAAQEKAWADADKRKQQRLRQIQVQNRADVKAKVTASVKEAMQRPEVKEKVKAGVKAAMQRPEVLAKMRKPKQEKVCPHCGHVGRGGIMLRWHFDNCKHKS